MPTLSFATGASPKNCPCPKKIKPHMDPQTPMAVDGGFAQNFWYLIRLSAWNCIQSQKRLHPKEEHVFRSWNSHTNIPHKLHRSPDNLGNFMKLQLLRGPSRICAGRVSEGYMQGFQWQSTAGRTLLAEIWSEVSNTPWKARKKNEKEVSFHLKKKIYSMEIHWWKITVKSNESLFRYWRFGGDMWAHHLRCSQKSLIQWLRVQTNHCDLSNPKSGTIASAQLPHTFDNSHLSKNSDHKETTTIAYSRRQGQIKFFRPKKKSFLLVAKWSTPTVKSNFH